MRFPAVFLDGMYPTNPLWTAEFQVIVAFELLVMVIEGLVMWLFYDRLKESKFWYIFIVTVTANIATFTLGIIWQIQMVGGFY